MEIGVEDKMAKYKFEIECDRNISEIVNITVTADSEDEAWEQIQSMEEDDLTEYAKSHANKVKRLYSKDGELAILKARLIEGDSK